MVANKHTSWLIIAVMSAAVVFCFLAAFFYDDLSDMLGGTGVKMEYESRLFDTDEVMNVEITMDGDEWEKMLDNAISEEYYVCDVVINGKEMKSVAIRPKGNTSLSAIAIDPDTDRYSLKLEFDHFVDGQTCYGLDKLILNNNYADATNMKEALIYDMYQYIGAESSLYNYAKVSVNGEYWGVYLALEGVEQSFTLRNFGTRDGEIYKPDSMEMGGGSSSSSSSSGGGPSMPGMGRSGGANLNYSDDDLDSYQTIWDGEITGTSMADHRRVVTALKNISEGNDIEKYLNVDNVLKYMAVHAFAVNMDSLSGSMAHNYYLYEYDGQLDIFPWDYNLSLGGMSMGGGDATDMVNDAIDTPFSGTKFFDALLADEDYLERYHEYLSMLTREYVDGGRFDEVYSRIRDQIDSLVETDPTAFYSYDEYLTAADMLYDVAKLRAKSIDGQIAGTIPSTDSAQREDSSTFVDASGIDVTLMGQFSMGGAGGGPGSGGFEKRDGSDEGSEDKADMGGFNPGDMPDMSSFNPEDMPDMGSFDPGNMPGGFGKGPGGNAPEGGPGGGNFGPGGQGATFNTQTIIVYGVCMGVMVICIAAAALFKRRIYVRPRKLNGNS